MFIDELSLHLKAGHGGAGVERWLQEKGKPNGGPSGGNGGRGGNVYAEAIRDIGVLSTYRNVKEYEAEKGEDGLKNTKHGGDGKDIVLRFPVGSRITNLSSGFTVDLMTDGEKVLLLKGGRGGLGNEHFKSSTNTKPKQTTDGDAGDEADFTIELLLVVDVGLIGLPNAGKSSLLNALTRAKSKVGAFAFTTLEPALGDFYGLVLADIPGLIEGASEGKGLGHKFLRHIERTKALLHLISSEDEDPVAAYQIVRKELELYNKEIMDKEEVLVLTKTDLITEEEKEAKMKALKKISKNVHALRIIDDKAVADLGNFLTKTFRV